MVATTTKRKKTADMPDSPPKRATRARAKATDEPEAGTNPTKITTASTKAAGEKKKAAVSARTSKRKARVDDEVVDMKEESAAIERPRAKVSKAVVGKTKKTTAPAKASKRKTRADEEEVETIGVPLSSEDVVVVAHPKAESLKTKGRQKKAGMVEEEKPQATEPPKTRGRHPRAAVVEEPKAAAYRTTRGRPKKEAERTTVETEHTEEIDERGHKPVKKITRGRAAANTAKPSAATASKSTAVATKKRVKFEEEPDKENIPIETVVPKRSIMKTTGIKAKPVRKAAAARGSARGKKAVQEGSSTQDGEKRENTPLSPKKISQVARSDQLSSEDELAGERNSIRALSKSPAKRPMSPIKGFGSVSKLNFNQQSAPASPTKATTSSISASPARRPPASPFKDVLRSPPKKAIFGDAIAQPVLLSSCAPIKTSLLQESPKKGLLESSVKPVLGSSQSPLKSSLLQSPARRPIASPRKAYVVGSPQKTGKESRSLIPTAEHSDQDFLVPTKINREWEDAPVIAGSGLSCSPASPQEQDDTAEDTALGQPSTTEAATFEFSIPDDFSDSIAPDGCVAEETAQEQSSMVKGPAFSIATSAYRRISVESEISEDELASPQKELDCTPVRRFGASTKDSRTPSIMPDPKEPSNDGISFTPLAEKFSSWNATSPEKSNAAHRSRQARGVFSLEGTGTTVSEEQIFSKIPATTPAKSSFFDDEMDVLQNQVDQPTDEVAAEHPRDLATFEVSQDSQASEEYGDENEEPINPEIVRAEQDAEDPTLTCTPAKVFTPARAVVQQSREFHTVSKVPLRASDDDSPLKVPRQRSRSFGAPLAVMRSWKQPGNIDDQDILNEQPDTPVLKATAVPQTPNSCMKLDLETPGRTVRKGVVPDVLKGAVVHVDVHTSEGADASGIFVDLLTQMGARCVKQWSWNPRASVVDLLDDGASPQASSQEVSASKVGITHVVYKDGGKRTLEKVRASNGIVLCVGVGWVLDCEREDKWLDEADYAIDTSLVPRGGSRRRKSMEPRALANLNGNLVPASNATPAQPTVSPTMEFLTFNTPASRRETFIIEPQQSPHESSAQEKLLDPAPSTPRVTFADAENDASAWGSPTTPYYLSKGAELVQRTCPPQQMGGLFPVSGELDDQPDEAVRRRLLEARRKSLQWASRIRSPLGRTLLDDSLSASASPGGIRTGLRSNAAVESARPLEDNPELILRNRRTGARARKSAQAPGRPQSPAPSHPDRPVQSIEPLLGMDQGHIDYDVAYESSHEESSIVQEDIDPREAFKNWGYLPPFDEKTAAIIDAIIENPNNAVEFMRRNPTSDDFYEGLDHRNVLLEESTTPDLYADINHLAQYPLQETDAERESYERLWTLDRAKCDSDWNEALFQRTLMMSFIARHS